MRCSLRLGAIAMMVALLSQSAWCANTAQASIGPLTLTVEDLTPLDGFAAGATLSVFDVFGSIEYSINGSPNAAPTPFTSAPSTTEFSVAGVWGSKVSADLAGNQSVSGSIEAGSYGGISAGTQDAYKIRIAPHTRITLQTQASAFAAIDDAFSSLAAWSNLQLEVLGDTFIDGVYAFANPWSSTVAKESGVTSITFSTGDVAVDGEVFRGASVGIDVPPIAAIPEPSTYALLLLGLGAVSRAARRKF